MGDSFNEGKADELPVHQVCLSAFRMDDHEVTNSEYTECVGAGSCTVPYYFDSVTRSSYYNNSAYYDFPVVNITWDQAGNYCRWAGKRLPTEAEWEYVARGGLLGERYPWGNSISPFEANFGNLQDADTSPVGNYPANRFGLYDITGNVYEWLNDWYDPKYYMLSPINNPQGPASGWVRVIRSSSFGSDPYSLRNASRDRFPPDWVMSVLGVRCAAD